MGLGGVGGGSPFSPQGRQSGLDNRCPGGGCLGFSCPWQVQRLAEIIGENEENAKTNVIEDGNPVPKVHLKPISYPSENS